MTRNINWLMVFFAIIFTSLCWAEGDNSQKAILQITDTTNSTTIKIDRATLDALPQAKITTTTPWYKTSQTFEGPLLRDVLKSTKKEINKLYVVALNDYAAEIPMEDIKNYDIILATKINGVILSIRDKGPLFVMYPFDQHPDLQTKAIFDRCVWQVNQIRIE